MIFVSLAFVSGVLLLQQFSSLPDPLWTAPALMIAFFLLRCRKYRPAVWFLGGWSWALLSANLAMNDTLDPATEGKDVLVDGQVTGIPQSFGRGTRFGFTIDRIHGIPNKTVPHQVRLSWYAPTLVIKAGDRWRFLVRLKRPHGSFNPAGFDYERWLYLQGYRATGYVRQGTAPKQLSHSHSTVSIDGFRQSIAERLSDAVKRSPVGGVIQALVIGDRHGITQEQWEVFRKTGTSHLVAISGLHIGLIAGLAFFLTKWFWVRFGSLRSSPSSIAAGSAILCALIYSAMAGFSLPTQRALMMITLVMGGFILRRKLVPGHTLAVALGLIVLIDPTSVLSPGLWLSFSAVALITYTLTARTGTTGRWFGIQKIHIVTATGLAPLLLLYFQQVSVVAPLANLVAVPVVSLLVIPISLLGGVLVTVVPVAGTALLTTGGAILETLWLYLQWLSQLPIAQWSGTQPSIVILVLAIAGLILLFAPRGIPGRWLSIPMLLPLFFAPSTKLDVGMLRFTLLDVGQGLAAVVETANHTLVFDTGARFSERFDMGSAVVAPFLKNQNIHSIDRLVISHADNDHIGGARSLSKLFRIDQIYTSTGKHIDWTPVTECKAGQTWTWDGIEFRMLAPITKHSNRKNDNSCVLKIISRSASILLTGDIERKTETELVEYYGGQLGSDYLVVPHHGSNTSSTTDFLKAVRPKYALVPAGYRNRYGFPRPQVIERLERVGARIYNTANSGAILIRSGSLGIPEVPTRYREQASKYYNFHAPVPR